ncbi:PP2C family protein-serine/threonine phosphatase [Pseudobutyrivibrio sp.]|uniref:PP2C family protein-serine/threonine phosphatase n=1 Tax=Pseudobutyrivibrio sp. TaxID=2014367 RepID=UPI001D9BEA19|nr:protein phosphatase 2C domain-containing protein [Pseudobutyrivibrio sp.]MBE5912006.1 serine/threonine-protein phosphatase [Pseudobutyrivibrio sp.]
MKVDYFTFSDKGDRENNEDYVLVRENTDQFCFVLNDGLGGCNSGEIASRLVAISIADSFDKGIRDGFIESSLLFAEKQLEEKQKDDSFNSMKTTSVVLLVQDDMAQWGHIGDSRLYYFKWNRIKERTLDHSVPQMLVNMREIKEKEIRFHKDRNRLLKALGNRDPNMVPTISEERKIKKGDAFLLCTDGFWEWIEEKDMTLLLKRTHTAKEWVEEMVKTVQKNGKGKDMDNISAIGVRIL